MELNPIKSKKSRSWKAFMQGAASIFCLGGTDIKPLREEDCETDIASCWKAVGDYMRTAFGYIDNVISQQQQKNDKNTH